MRYLRDCLAGTDGDRRADRFLVHGVGFRVEDHDRAVVFVLVEHRGRPQRALPTGYSTPPACLLSGPGVLLAALPIG